MSTRVRPAGVAPGALALLGALAGIGMITALTGSPAAMMALVALAATIVASFAAGALAIRDARVTAVSTARLTTVGDPLPAVVDVQVRRPARVELRLRGNLVAAGWATAAGPVRLDGVAAHRGRFDRVEVRCLSSGRLGLVWWRRTFDLPIDPLLVSPALSPEAAPTVTTPSDREADTSAVAGDGADEPDGIRPWADGDSANGVHWPTSLRSGSLVVRQRRGHAATTTVAAARSDAPADEEAARVRTALSRALAQGHHVAVREDHGDPQPLDSADAVARWAAVFNDSPPTAAARPWWQRALRITRADEPVTVSLAARCWLAAATLTPVLMLLSSLGVEPMRLLVVAAASALAVVGSRLLTKPILRQLAGLTVGIGLTALLADFSAASSPIGALRSVMPQLLAGLVVAHGFDCAERRSTRVALAIAVFLTAYAAALRIDARLAWWCAGAAILIVVAFLSIDNANRVRHPMRSTALGIAVIAALTLAALQFIPLPRGPAQLTLPSWLEDRRPTNGVGELAAPDGSPLLNGAAPSPGNATSREGGDTGGSYPGFSPSLDTSLRGDLGDEVVLRVRAAEPDFWRGQIFATFDGRSWFPDAHLGVRTTGPDVSVGPSFANGLPLDQPWGMHDYSFDIDDTGDAGGPTLTQTFYPQVDLPNLLFAAPSPNRVLIDAAVWQRPDGALRADVTLTAGSAYTVVSRRGTATESGLRADGVVRFSPTAAGDTPLDAYLQLPDSTSERTLELADDLASSSPTTYDYVRSIEAWLGANTAYSLDAPVPPDGQDAVDHFLFDSRLGFCEQIASAMAVMLRSQGVPARVATGYVPSERDEVAGVWVSRGRDAHAWVEVYFPSQGWVPFDPTASVPLSGETSAPTIGAELLNALRDWTAGNVAWLLVALLGGAAAVAMWRGTALVRHRRSRGRWGLLQDRFAQHSVRRGASPLAANADLAAAWQHPEAAVLAERLDASAFDPHFTDNDESFAAAQHLLAGLLATHDSGRA
jgi:protein-glutamine gamma-glutamyltransferase